MTVETIQTDLLNNIDGKFDKSNGSWTYDVLKSTAIEFQKLETRNSEVINMLDIENLTGDELARYVYQRTGIQKRVATYATGIVKLTLTGASEILEGDLVAADDVFYEVTENYSFTNSGVYSVNVRCQSSGIIGNVPVGAIKDFPVTLPNVSAVINDVAFTNGYESESDISLRERYYEKLQNSGKSGNKAHYKEWASEISGVGKVKVFPRFNGPLNVRVAILDTNGSLAPEQLLTNVLNHIESEKPFGANVSVVTGTQKLINIKATFLLTSGYTWQQIEPLLVSQINSYFKSIAFEEDVTYISYAQIGREILSVEGIEDYSGLLINNGNINIPLNDLEVGVVEAVTKL